MVPAAVLATALSAPAIDLYTIGPGEPLFERFGHAAICVVREEDPRFSRCYNYGTADFESPPEQIGWDFVRGTSRFWVSVTTPARMLGAYERADRTIYRQRLRLTPEQSRSIAERLAHDALPENREYLYHHFRDNCATRLRDLIDSATRGALGREGGEREPSYRAMARDALAGVPLALVASDVFVGRRADLPATPYEAMFLPGRLRDGARERLGSEAQVVYARRGSALPRRAGPTWPYFAGVAVALTAPPLIATFRGAGGRARALSFVPASIVLAVLGAAVWGVAVSSAVPELRWNEALVVFWPTDFLLALLPDAWRERYARLRLISVLGVSALLALGVFVQPLFAAVLLVALPMAVATDR